MIPFPSDDVTPPVTKIYLVELDIKCNYGCQNYKK
jgi:hypothetical protein